MGQILVIGYGNTFRRDDGAGVALAAQLAARWQAQVPVRLVTVTQLVPELAIDIAAADVAAVVFVDTSVGEMVGEMVGELNRQIGVMRVADDSASPVMGHYLGPAVLMIYARLYHDRNLPAWLVTVPGIDFAHGEGLSPAVQQLLSTANSVVDRLRLAIEEHFRCMNLPLHNV